jgi:hypothetical protein
MARDIDRAPYLGPDGDWLSLVKLTGQKIVDIDGDPSDSGGFNACRIYFEDGTTLWLSGDRDGDAIAYRLGDKSTKFLVDLDRIKTGCDDDEEEGE